MILYLKVLLHSKDNHLLTAPSGSFSIFSHCTDEAGSKRNLTNKRRKPPNSLSIPYWGDASETGEE